MNLITFLSNLIIPIIIFYIIGYGIMTKTDIFDAFVKGAADGMHVVLEILPTLIGLMVAIGLMRESGFLNVLADVTAPFVRCFDFPAQVVPLTLIKMVSSSAATGLLTDIFKEFGTDSREGYLASLLMCCSETIFYTISVYFLATKDKKHSAVTGVRWLLAGALLCTFVGIVA
ncbi:MAG TPA: spore maturation protein, partial [Lachnospiraceae bacterium]|nr:spore maturation protein [Lachnospiraceae bacterium]